ncbi:hypothetical protein K7432_016371 [Basidiobolus ranarum]|uniref:Uncharacterized protein n=1 Tax=Basidiobolus ranarum TaxID=34480 RepID=A0ABR2WEV0_9FUNG
MCTVLKYLAFVGWTITSVYGDVTFNVVGFPTKEDGKGDSTLAVSVNNQWIKLTTTPETFPLWSGVVPGVTTPLKYQYGILDGSDNLLNKEKFIRELQEGTQSKNDFFTHSQTMWKFTEIPNSWETSNSIKPEIFLDGKIGTFHLTADPTEMSAIHTGDIDGDIKVNLTFIHPDFTKSLNNVSLGISGQSSRLFAKQSYKLKFKDSGEFFSTRSIKLRAEETDPTMMREKIYIDLLNSFGVASIQANWARLFVNKQPVGLFLMTDDVKSPFLKRTFHDSDENAKIGAGFKCNAIEETKAANLAFKGGDLTGYDFQNTYEVEEAPDGKDVAHHSLVEFMKIISDFNPVNASDNDLKKLSEVWDYSHFLRAMALEFLAGSWDTFWKALGLYSYRF